MPLRIRTLAALALLGALAPVAAWAESHGIERAYMDTTVSPCADFFSYANGGWIKTATIPASYTGVGASREMADRNQAALQRVLEGTAAAARTENDPTLRKLGLLYLACLDSARADREGAAPISASMARIDAIKTREELRKFWAQMALDGAPGPFRFGAEPDRENSRINLASLGQGGLGLPEREYYFRRDPKSDSLRAEYVAHMGRMFALLGEPADRAAADAGRVMKLETALAESSMARVQMRDPHATFHKMKTADLAALAPGIDWKQFFSEVGVASLAAPDAPINVGTPSFVRRLDQLAATTPMEDWHAYLRWRLVREAAPWMGSKFFAENFAFQSRLSGQREPEPQWKRAAAACDQAMGEALGKAYVEREFPASSKARMLELVNNLQATLRERIASRPWMSDATRQQAIRKLDAVLKKIGYPDQWRDYSKLRIDAGASAIADLMNARAFEARRRLDQIGQPVDRMEWGMTTPTVNAYYNPTRNEIVFPAGILAPPRFDPLADDALNYGAIGMVIGHELTHGFDDSGSQFDAEGNLKNWWSDEDGKKFKEKAQRVVDQYNGYVAVDTLHVNGRLTLGENIADLGGLTIAYYAYERSLRGKPRPPLIDGFTPEQRFFLGHAQGWRSTLRDEAARTRALTDPHSPARWRVNGPLSNMPEFAKAFGCSGVGPMVRDESVRAEIW